MQMYFIAVVLPEELDEKVLEYKKRMFEIYGCKVGLKSPAHITIAPPYWMENSLEEELISNVNSFASTINEFTIDSNNFSAFKPRTIFIDVRKNDALEKVKKESDAFFKQHSKFGIKIETRPFHPHITIATRDLRKSAFYEAWEIFKDRIFQKQFIAEGLSILRHNKKNWDVIHTSQFKKNL